MTDPTTAVEQTTPTETTPASATTPTPLDLSSLNPGNPFPQSNPFAQAPAPTETAAAAPAQATDADELPAGWRKHIEDLRKENAETRVKSEAKAAQAAQEAAERTKAEILGIFKKAIDPDSEVELTPEQLVAQAQAKIAETEADAAAKIAAAEAAASDNAAKARKTDVALTVLRRAGADVDSDALLDSSSFAARMSNLDPAADDFASQVDTEIAAFLDANPGRYRRPAGLVNTVPRSGGDFEAGNAHQPTGEPSVESLLKQVQDSHGHGRASRGFRSST